LWEALRPSTICTILNMSIRHIAKALRETHSLYGLEHLLLELWLRDKHCLIGYPIWNIACLGVLGRWSHISLPMSKSAFFTKWALLTLLIEFARLCLELELSWLAYLMI
jgi:hypothetical protein